MRRSVFAVSSVAGLCCGAAWGQAVEGAHSKNPEQPAWREAEAATLTNHWRLTSTRAFEKAGEAYFDPYGRWVIFQAVPKPEEGKEPDKHYSMYVAKVGRGAEGEVKALDLPIRVSPEGSANTCGWFSPDTPYRVIFGSTLTPLADATQGESGYRRADRKYVWAFPREMELVRRSVAEIFDDLLPGQRETLPEGIGDDETTPRLVFPNANPGYDAEASFSPDGRFILYTHVNPETNDPDLYVYEVGLQTSWPLVTGPGYDGGAFFSPGGGHIAWRADRKQDDLLQIYVAELEESATGAPLRIKGKERQVTDNGAVNWAPFWHPTTGRFLVYTSSEVGHDNYEVFSVEAPVWEAKDKTPAQLRKKRITFAAGFDGLPAFSKDGRTLMWTSQRSMRPELEKESSQVWAADVVDVAP